MEIYCPRKLKAVNKERETEMADKKHNAEDKKVLIIIPKPRNVVGDTETVVSVNGEMYQIMYDSPVEVPYAVAEIIAQSRELEMKIAKACDANILKPGKAALAEL